MLTFIKRIYLHKIFHKEDICKMHATSIYIYIYILKRICVFCTQNSRRIPHSPHISSHILRKKYPIRGIHAFRIHNSTIVLCCCM